MKGNDIISLIHSKRPFRGLALLFGMDIFAAEGEIDTIWIEDTEILDLEPLILAFMTEF